MAPIFTRGCTVTFNPNGGALKDGEKAIREIDLKSVENGQFFDSDTNVSISLTDGVPEDATLSADTIAQESVLGSRPELKEELPGLLSIYDISVRQNGETLEIKDNPMTVKIPLNDHLKGYKYYQAVYLGDPLEPPPHTEQQGKPSEQIESPQTGDSSEYGAVDQPDDGFLRRRAGNAVLQAEKSIKQNRQKNACGRASCKIPQPAPAQPALFCRRDIPSLCLYSHKA